MCLPPAVCLGAPMSPSSIWGCLCRGWGMGPVCQEGHLQAPWGCVLALPLTPCVILAKLLPLLGPQFPICVMGRLN